MQIGAEHLHALELLGARLVKTVLFAAAEFRFGRGQIAQAILPIGFQAASYESVLGLHGSVAAFGLFGLVARPFHFQPPLRQSRVVIGLELFDREPHSFHGSRRNGFEKGVGHGVLDSQAADRETVLPASIHDIFAGAVVTRRRVPAAIVNMQTPAAMTTGGNALQQR
jgi:hypothetical protein